MNYSDRCYQEYVAVQRKLQPYSNTLNYPPRLDDACDMRKNIPTGYQPMRPNPGGLKFSVYSYPFQTTGNVPLTFPGRGWRIYENTGNYNIWW